MSRDDDHYRTLELRKDADYKKAKEQKNDLLLVWHPDKQQKNERVRKKAERKTQEIDEEVTLAWYAGKSLQTRVNTTSQVPNRNLHDGYQFEPIGVSLR